jgi:hypothetical protein
LRGVDAGLILAVMTKQDRQATSVQKRARRSRAEWAREARQWRRSGQPAEEYATAHGLRTNTLTWWASQLGIRATTSDREAPAAAVRSPAFLQVRVVGDSPGQTEASRDGERTPEEQERKAGPGLELLLRNGRSVRVDVGFDAETLTRLLAVAEGAAAC